MGESVDAESEVDWYIGTVPGIRLLNVGGTQFGQEDVVQSVASRVGGMLSVESWRSLLSLLVLHRLDYLSDSKCLKHQPCLVHRWHRQGQNGVKSKVEESQLCLLATYQQQKRARLVDCESGRA